jgi:hypothetical protein
METYMLNVASAQVAKSLGLSTHGYVIGSDAKTLDAQASQESGTAAVMGALGGINMISGAGMLDSLACHSAEKLVLDAESIAMAQRLLQGLQACTETLALDMFAKVGVQGDFLKLPETRELSRQEQRIPGKVVHRGSLNFWEQSGKKDAFARDKDRVNELIAACKRPELPPEVEQHLRNIVEELSKHYGMERLLEGYRHRRGETRPMTSTPAVPTQTEIRTDWQLPITVDMVLRGQGADPNNVRQRQPRLVALAERAIAEGTLRLRPQIAFSILDVLEPKPGRVILSNGTELKGFGIVRKLTGAASVIAAVATLGPELERQIQWGTQEQPAFALALDGFGTAAIRALSTALRRFFEQKAGGPLATTAPLYPGMRGWELAPAQRQLFSLVDTSAIGVTLNSSFLMIPTKSLSMVIGVRTKLQPAAQPCEECGASSTCSHRMPNS